MKISIIVPIYNVENELERCIDSLINQTYTNLEIILVDDGSTDSCPIICDNYKKKDNRIIVFHKKNGGLSDARNFGIKNSTGDYLLFVDSDDYILSDSCEKFVKLIDEKIDIIVGEASVHENFNITYLKHNSLTENTIYTSKEYIINSIINNEFYAPVCFNLYRKEFIINNNLYFKKGILHEDMEILLRSFLKAEKIKFLKYTFYQYIIRKNSINNVKKDYSRNIRDSFEIYSDWKTYIDGIEDNELKKYLYCVLSKYVITTCKRFKVKKNLPKGIDNRFLLKNTINFKELLKTIFFVLFRNIYIRL